MRKTSQPNWQQQLREKISVNGVSVTPFLYQLLKHENFQGPISLQHLPSPAENNKTIFKLSEIWEKESDFLDGQNGILQQKYPDIMLIRLANTCNSFCRFCFNKERTILCQKTSDQSLEHFKKIIKIIAKKKDVYQILLSGGDPLIYPDAYLLPRLQMILQIPQIKTVRLNTRALLHNPFRITADFCTMLKKLQNASWQTESGKQIEIGVHFNHPSEITPQAILAIRKLQKNNIQLYNQTVLLKKINDDVEILAELFKKLLKEGVRLHYLSQTMTVPGTDHFRYRVKNGQEIMRQLRQKSCFRGKLPHFELSHHTGKQIIPDDMNKYFFEKIIIKKNKKIRMIKFFSDITHKWELFPDGK